MQNKLLGFYVVRSKHGKCKVPVWAGFTENERQSHQEWIIKHVSNAEYDGLTTFENVESDVIITSCRVYTLKNGKTIRIESINGFTAFGYIQKRTKSGKIKDHILWHGYVNGMAYGNFYGNEDFYIVNS